MNNFSNLDKGKKQKNISCLENYIYKTFDDFLSHELISKDPFSIDENEIWNGIKSRSSCRPQHQCKLINRMNRYCTLVKIEGRKVIPVYNKPTEYGILSYIYNPTKKLELLFSLFRYPSSFKDYGPLKESFATGDDFGVIIDCFDNNKRISCDIIDPAELFQVENIETNLFLEYTVCGFNRFKSIKQIPFFANLEGDESYFIKEVRISLMKTKYFLLSLVMKYPNHLMVPVPPEFLSTSAYKEIYDRLFHDKMEYSIANMTEQAAQQIASHQIDISLPF